MLVRSNEVVAAQGFLQVVPVIVCTATGEGEIGASVPAHAVAHPGRERGIQPDLLTPEEVDVLVRVVLWKAIHDDDSAEPAAKFCTRVFRAELDGGFVDQLLWTCRKWLKQHDVPVQSSTFWAPLEPKTQKNAGQKLIAFVNFTAVLLPDVPENPGAASLGSLHSGHIFSMAALLCDSCRLVMNSPQLDYEAKVECLRRALTTAGEAAERGAPARMAALVDCLRDAFLSSGCSRGSSLDPTRTSRAACFRLETIPGAAALLYQPQRRCRRRIWL
ncbi:hypothetical protein HPB51_028438 [Rhipicephalus microplus]|uniref:Uncharacterized protein n=1 Tax=Rhipicephalus microplus TaxID=6941 RepID=A0A9J6CXA1_RHIMP|nr:hypothetical protein HPB51_028438 [Rhipicephalus microplus]